MAPDCLNLSALLPMMLAQIIVIASTEISGDTGRTILTNRGAR